MSISIHLIRGLVDCLDQAGLDAGEFLRQCNFDQNLLDDSDLRIDMATYDRLQNHAIEFSGNPALGLHMGKSSSIGTKAILGYLFLNCPTARDGLDAFFRYHSILSDCADSQLIEDEDTATLYYRFPRSSNHLNQLRAEFGLAQIREFSKLFAGDEEELLEVGFEHDCPDYDAEYRELFPCKRLYNQEETYIRYKRSILDRKQRHSNEDLYHVLKQRAEEMIGCNDHQTSFADQVKQHIMQFYRGKKPSMKETAEFFSISDRSLRRRLQDENSSFAKVLNQALETLAKNALARKHLPIKEVALQLGFAESSSFNRAFKQWTGITPTEFRKQL